MPATVAQRIAETLTGLGARTAYGVIGDGNVDLFEALAAAGVRYVPARHEGGAAVMADVHHRVSGEVAICTSTYGPGFTNLATGLAEAARHCSGMLVLAGDSPTTGERRIDADHAALAASLGVHVERITDPALTAGTTRRAWLTAERTSRPVALLVPADLTHHQDPRDHAIWPVSPREVTSPRGGGPAGLHDHGDLEAAVAALAGARRPLLLAGLGAVRAGAGQQIAALADDTGALLATTAMARGLFGEHPWCIGMTGGFADPGAVELIRRADVVVGLGTGLSPWGLPAAQLGDGAVLVQVTDTGAAAERTDLAVRADVAHFVETARKAVAGRAAPAWRDEVGAMPAGWAATPFEEVRRPGVVDPRALTVALRGLLPPDRVLVTDGGHFVAWPLMYWPVAEPSRLAFTGAAFQSVGLGLAGAVGAAVARPGAAVVLAAGDGGALMGLAELETLVRVAPSALVVVYDDGGYGAELHRHARPGLAAAARFGTVDLAGVARSLGARAATVRSVADLGVVEEWNGDGRPGTLLLDCKVDPDVVAPFMAARRPG